MATKVNLDGINELDFDLGGTTSAAITAPGVVTLTNTGGAIVLETDGTPNGDQALLNLKAGTNITLTDDGVGGVTIDATGGGGSLTAPVIIDTGTVSTVGLEVVGSVSGTPTPTFVQGATGFSAGSNPTATFGSSNATGNCILVAVSQDGFTHSGISVTDTAGNSYTLLSATVSNFGAYVFAAFNIVSGPNTITVTQTNSANVSIAIHEYSGVALAAALETSATASTFGSPPGPGAVGPITTAGANDLLFTMFQMGGAGTSTISGFTVRETEASGTGPDLRTADANEPPGTYTPTWVYSGLYTTYSVIVVALKRGVGGGQIADLVDYEDASSTVLSSVNGIGQFVMTKTAGSATNTPDTGALNYNTTSGALEIYDGAAWVPVSSGGATPGISPLSPVPTLASTGLTTAYNHTGSLLVANTALGISMSDTTTTGGLSMEGQAAAYPGVPFTMSGLFTLPQTGANFISLGMFVASGLTSQAMYIGAVYASGWHIEVNKANSPTSFNAGLATFPFSFVPQTVWLRYQDDGTHAIFSVSTDGVFYTQVYSVAKTSSFLSGTGFNNIGVFVCPQGVANGTTLAGWTLTTP